MLRPELALVLLVCAAPVIASYFTYYVIRPDGRRNYGELIEPQRRVVTQGGHRRNQTGAGHSDRDFLNMIGNPDHRIAQQRAQMLGHPVDRCHHRPAGAA